MNNTHITIVAPCLVDQVYPEIGVQMLKLFKHLGVDAEVATEFACCGQPAFNTGQIAEAKSVATAANESLYGVASEIVCPSGSCTSMIRCFYPELIPARELGGLPGRVFELSEFLARDEILERIEGSWNGKFGYQNSCHTERELRVKDAAKKIFSRLKGAQLVDMEPVCCGFGGLFSVKFSPIAGGMAKSRLEGFRDKGIDTIVANDPGCIMHLRAHAKEFEIPVRILHLVEFLGEAMGITPEWPS